MAGRLVRRRARVGLLCVGFALGISGSRPASACLTTPPPPGLVGYPSDGEIEVPTDVVPFYGTSFPLSGLTTADFSLVSSAGDAIALQAAATQLYTVDLTLGKVLAANTSYTLSANLHVESGATVVDTVTFTTGAGPVSSVPDPPQAFLQHYQLGQPIRSSCSPWSEGTCVAVSAGLPVEEVYSDELGEQLWEPAILHESSWFNNLSGINQGTPFRCVRLRTRAANATYSAPVVLCGAGAPLVTICGSERIACSERGLTQDDALLNASAGRSSCPSGGTGGSGPTSSPGMAGSAAAIGGAAPAGGSVSGADDAPLAVSPGGMPGSPAGSGGLIQAGALGGPQTRSAACSFAEPSKSAASWAIAAPFALAWAARFRRSRRARNAR